ncbi:MAG TPA: hypothetical protein VJJ02_05310 [Candidatus Paceibacterota bacterium]
MKGKQILIDVGVVLVIPALLLVGYYFWSPRGDSALLSLVAPPEEREYGAQAKAALASLRSITMDGSLFEDPVYKSLQEFHVDIEPATLGRTYPFTSPDSVRTLIPKRSSASSQ